MTIHQCLVSMNRLAIQAAMKPTERIVCTNATVVMDTVTERISYFDNDTPVGVIETKGEHMKTARIFTNDFNRIIAATKPFVGTSDHHLVYQYIKLEFDAEHQQVTAVALDGHRLSVEHAVISDCEESFKVYIKSNIKLPSKQYAKFTLEDEEVIVRCGDFIFGCHQPKPEEFDWQKAIPTSDIAYRIGFNGNYLLSALQAAKVSCGGSFSQLVVLEFRSPLEPIILRTNQEDVKLVLPIRMIDCLEEAPLDPPH